MAKLKLLLVVLCVAAICAVSVGCASPTANSTDFVGVWRIESMAMDGEEVSTEEIATLKSLDMDIVLTVGEDGTFNFDRFGEAADGEWEFADGKVQLNIAGNDAVASIDSERLVLEQGNTKMVFARD